MSKIALIDNDVIQHFADARNKTQEEKEDFVHRAFESLEIQGQMHELIYKNEFQNRNNAQGFFDHGLFSVLALEKIFEGNENKKTYYCKLIYELYRKMAGNELEIKDVLSEWRRHRSLGEVHCFAACMVGPYGIFISDDHGSKSLNHIIRTDYERKIAVYNREELYQQLQPGVLNKSERKAFTHVR